MPFENNVGKMKITLSINTPAPKDRVPVLPLGPPMDQECLVDAIAVGSSRTTHFGRIAMIPAIAILCFCPPESWFGA